MTSGSHLKKKMSHTRRKIKPTGNLLSEVVRARKEAPVK